MADIKLLKKLRETTKAAFKDCKEAIEKTGGDFDASVEYLKEKGASKAAKKFDRDTNDGVVKVLKINGKNVGVKLGCETDFVAKSPDFHALVEEILNIFGENLDSIDSLNDVDSDFIDNNLTPIINSAIGTIGENIKLLDVFVDSGKSYIYSHPGDKIITVVYYDGGDFDDSAKEIALQITAMDPEYKSIQDVPSDYIEAIKNGFREEIESSGKPKEVLEKILEGKVSKHFGDIVLMEQSYIRDESKKMKDILPDGFDFLKFRRYSI
ncbi:translation elongation factor Ts [Candidatus Vampirococcus lugosii]|uniref:Elongation factor Ts n=1 Tax=Candidatus Vampirococcus lugosii TaxID=2789015 RepID=A0ABS5QKN2_9BACT|nr:translation elongation factor Ts [Candidatus Vampirococcus lugosii]MBS8121795.1 elongation factor Ts [Candidatus Vampirococcus lugosii]